MWQLAGDTAGLTMRIQAMQSLVGQAFSLPETSSAAYLCDRFLRLVDLLQTPDADRIAPAGRHCICRRASPAHGRDARNPVEHCAAADRFLVEKRRGAG